MKADAELMAKEGVVYAHASDGTPLHWLIKEPPGSGKCPAVVGIHGGGFWSGGDATPIRVCGPDVTSAGFIMFSPEYRLAPPGHLTGQVSKGQYPDQTNDIQLAIDAALAHPRCNGSVQLLGGSAGAYFAAWFAAKGVAPGLCMSPATDLDEPGGGKFNSLCNAYAPGHLVEASPCSYVSSTSKPVFLRAYVKDSMPPSQFTLFRDALVSNGVPNDCKLLPGAGHSFDMWPLIKKEGIAWLKAHA